MAGGMEHYPQTPLLPATFSDSSDTNDIGKKGTIWTAVAHVITGVIGAGVLSLAWSTAQLGWIAGPLAIMFCAAVTLFATSILCDCYKSPDSEHGPTTNHSLLEAARFYFRTLWTAVAHIISAVIGAGVLSLAWCTAQLGWIAGPITMLCFAVITYISASLICDCYRSPDPITGTRNPSYIDAVRVNLGKKWTWLCGLLQYVSFYGTGIAYVITSATSMREIQISNCYHGGGEKAVCQSGTTIFMLIFGIIQIVMSQIPDFHNMAWLSVVAALMSFCYSFIGLGLGFSKVIDNRGIKGSIVGVPTRSAAQKIWLVFQGLGDIAFAYPYSIILLEIQDTLKSPPPENQTMKKASITAIVITTFFYLCCSCFGYAAFGNDTPGNLLTGFYEPFWLVDFANACIVLHLVGGYQVYSQPIFAFVEKWATQKYPENRFLNKFYAIKLPVLPSLQLNLFRLCFRTLYVISTTAIAMAFPYFNQVLGILGALNFWPMTIYFPVEMYIVQRKIGAWTKKWLLLEGFSMICLIVSLLGLIGSIEGIVSAKLAKIVRLRIYRSEMEVQRSLEQEKTSGKDDDTIRTGTLWTAVAHIISAVIGAGVLSLAWCTAQLGWIAGPITMLCFAVITYISASLICDCYRSPDPITGTRNPSYIDAVRVNLGKKWTWLCGLLQYVSFYGTGIAYVITSATSMREIQISNCYHEGGEKAVCQSGTTIFMLIFGIIQIVMSQIPDFHNMAWLSVVAALMSFCYSFIGLGLGFSKVIDNRGIKGSIVGVPTRSAAQKIWLVFQGLGDIAFAYPYSIILLEIQDTLKSPPPENQTMKKASITAIVITTFFYLCCSCFGYAAFGNDTPGNLLTGFYEPFWLVDFANACIVLHLVGGYQVYSQPIFAFVEKWATQKYPENRFLNKFYAIKLPVLPSLQLNLFRLCFRTLYVISTTAIAMAFPYFNQVLGILGALNFWPMTIYFPVEMYIVQRKIGAWTKKWLLLEGFSMICLIVSLLGLIGSIEGIVSAKLAKT